MNRIINLSPFIARASDKEKRAYNRILRSIALLLKDSDVQFGYLYEDELYSGALIYDQGIDRVFINHARPVQKMFRDHGVKKVITVDPHTTNMLRHVYPEVLGKFDLEVQSYIEVLAERRLNIRQKLEDQVMIHDSCVYARYEGIIEQPRDLLHRAGLTVKSPELSGALTFCCGGPIESLFPSQAHAIASKRAEQLMSAGCRVVTMCPICLVNLKHAIGQNRADIKDISEYLVEALFGESKTMKNVRTYRDVT